MTIEIREDDLRGPRIAELLTTHLAHAAEHSPPGSIHALDLDSLRAPGITFWSAWTGDDLLGCGALRELSSEHGEIKSMHTAAAARGQGVGATLLTHILDEARARGYRRVSLETGTMDGFAAARALYTRAGFAPCPPFADYFEDPNSVCMTLELAPRPSARAHDHRSDPMTVELRLTDEDQGQVIRNLWPLYVHDVSAFDGSGPNRHGVLSDDDAVASPAQQAEGQGPWWREPGVLFPYLIVADGRAAGFNLIAARSRLPEGLDADFVVYEFFVLHAWRGSAVAQQAATQGFDRHRGRWEVVTYPNHPRAIAFWRRTLDAYTQGRFEQEECDHVWGRKVVFRFDNSAGGAGD